MVTIPATLMTSPILRTAFSDTERKKICEWVQAEEQTPALDQSGKRAKVVC